MGQTLTNGIFLPNEGERNCYTGLEGNWRAIDGYIGGYNVHVADAVIHVSQEDRTKWDAVTGKADTTALTAHTGDTTIHVTAEDKNKWDAVTSKADDSNVVHKGGNETINGLKTFENNKIVVGSSTKIGSSVHLVNADVVGDNANGSSSFEVYGSSISSDNKIGSLTIGEYSNNSGAYALIECNRTVNGVKSTNAVRLLIRSDGKKEFTPAIDNDCRSGIPSFRWADVNTVLINGINPGALFLPRDRSVRVDISAYFTNTANGATNRVTPPEDGYIFLGLTDVLIVHCFSQNASNLTHYGQTFARPSAGQLYCLFPVRKNDNVAVQWHTTATDVTVSNAYFIPCKGNI